MRATEFIIEAEGTFYHGTRSDFDFDQLGSGKGLQTFDRILGPHFSATPDIASKFALGDPQTKGARTNKLDGARVFPATIPGEIYRVPQPPTVNDATAIIIDAVKKIVLPNKELVSELLNAAATGLLPMLKLSNDKVELPQAYATATKLIAEPVEWKKGITWGEMTAADYLDRYAPVGLVTKVAGMYKEMLISQGYGLIEYRNTNKRETKGMKSNVSYIALMKPQSKFERQE